MPLYDFKCKACGQEDELLASMQAQKSGEPCAACGGVMERLPVIKMHLKGARSMDEGPESFTKNADSFIGAMDDFGDKMGCRLTRTEKGRAVARLESARKV